MSFYITTAIDYVNGEPHLGHAYEKIATDVIVRHRRQRGEDVFFLIGTDEHGEPVADSARANGYEPQQWADKNAAQFKALWPRLNISNDFFIRTTDPQHKLAVQKVMQRIYDNGYVYKGAYEGWYCPRCADFKTESEIVDGNRCPIHEIELTWEAEENWFFKLSAFQERLEQLYAEQPEFVMPPRAMNEVLAFAGQGLQDLSLSRSHMNWGVEVPWDPAHVFYVWFDALLSYYTGLSYAREGEDLTEHYWPASYHVIGKDIVKFHAIYWPAMLMAADIPLPEHVFVHGFLMAQDGRKMSKSLGNVLDPFEVMDLFGTDALRYYLLREVQFGQDGNVGIDGCKSRYDSELANDYGNLASRTVAMIGRYRDGIVPAVATDPVIAAEFAQLPAEVAALFDRMDSSQALELIWQRVRRLNRYAEERQPWQLAKDPEQSAVLDQTLASMYEGVRAISVLLYPYIPESIEKLMPALGASELGYDAASFAAVGSGTKLEKLAPLFPKVAAQEAA
jgi:methionyl-tRNA synthetase